MRRLADGHLNLRFGKLSDFAVNHKQQASRPSFTVTVYPSIH
jgi:hypothetical protein